MPLNGYTMGRDVSINVNTSLGPMRLGTVTKFKATPDIGSLTVNPLNGPKDTMDFPNGWKGTISIERTDSTADDYQAQWEDDYFQGVTRGPSSITETTQETGGNFSVFRYTQVQIHLSDTGEKAGDKSVAQEFTWTARRRLKVS